MAGPTQERVPLGDLENAFEAKELKSQTSPSFVTEIVTLPTVVCRIRSPSETLGQKRKEVVMLAQYVRSLAAFFE